MMNSGIFSRHSRVEGRDSHSLAPHVLWRGDHLAAAGALSIFFHVTLLISP